MGNTTEITWTDSTFNPWIGCTKVSAGCTNCYAAVGTLPRVQRSRGIELWGADAARHVTSDANWAKPLKWNRDALAAGERRRVFCASMADVFEDRRDLDEHRERLWRLIEATPQLDWLLLTKRPENMVRLASQWGDGWPANVWAGTTVEDQAHAERRLLWLVEVPAAVRFVSYEPALGPVDFTRVTIVAPDATGWAGAYLNALTGHVAGPDEVLPGKIHWVIIGGESGAGARIFDMRWARAVIAQCRAAGTAVFFKQAGRNPIVAGGGLPNPAKTDMLVRGLAQSFVYRLRDAKGGDLAELPPELAVREFPR